MIDMHTHIFPDKIAAKTVGFLEQEGGSPAYTDGTAAGLLRSMDNSGIELSVILPVVTNPDQFDSVNRFAAAINEEYKKASHYRLISFGGIHPDSSEYRAQLREIKSLGLKGIKLHPDYQYTYIDDIKYKRLISYASELGLIITVHSGLDIGLPDPIHCTPDRALRMFREVQPEKLILAHLGGFGCWDQAEELLTGLPLYMDLGYVLGNMKDEQLVRIIRKHGVERILFATDSPWGDQRKDLEYFRQLPFDKQEQELILSGNALSLGIV